jgi:hypothetical protein
MLRPVERVSIRTTSVVRGVIVTSLLGHWVANALFDRDEYPGAGGELLARLDDPFLVQALLGLLVVACVSIPKRWRTQEPRAFAGRLPLACLLVGLQLVVFVGLESSERVTVELFAGDEAHVGIFGAGFVAELVVAVGSALILAVLAEATKRWLGILRPAELGPPRESRLLSSVGFVPPRRVLSGAGGVRAPPR